MADTTSKKTKQPEVHPVAIAISGAIFGAGAAIAGFMALRDEKNRQKVKKILVSTKDQISEYLEELKTAAEKSQDEVEDMVEEKIKEVKPRVKKVKTAAKEIKRSVKKATKA